MIIVTLMIAFAFGLPTLLILLAMHYAIRAH